MMRDCIYQEEWANIMEYTTSPFVFWQGVPRQSVLHWHPGVDFISNMIIPSSHLFSLNKKGKKSFFGWENMSRKKKKKGGKIDKLTELAIWFCLGVIINMVKTALPTPFFSFWSPGYIGCNIRHMRGFVELYSIHSLLFSCVCSSASYF